MKIEDAAKNCHMRGYIAPKSNPDFKLWKNKIGFSEDIKKLRKYNILDWVHYDPEGNETSIIG